MLLMLATLPGHVLTDAKRPLFCLLLGFILTFILVRLSTRLTRARGDSRLSVGSIVTSGGLHIHHSVFGIIGMIVTGILQFALGPGSPWVEMLAFAFGSGAALTLDEFALILHLEDVYWTREGRASIDAVILGVTFITLLLTGLLPRSIDEVGDITVVSRWVGSVLVIGEAAFVVTSYLKGKLYLGTVGIFFAPAAVIGAVRLAKPDSPWARMRYRRNPVKLERARRREESFNARWRPRKHHLWDVIGGKPHLHLPHRLRPDDHRDEHRPGGSYRTGA
jgi:lysyl-tRNA synthetase, class II